ncbi:u22-Nephitoxin-Nsp1b_2 [Trichonephila inaurata madagascariensis]|uniref:U22-Nephitoxin-Nsp1b_2 n=1 Tax=Trichonephila inaurata madagascariensis TaxID=2747483 RepID=A0A8X6YT64_9ARAC|nr:u22-Nephitoxin-Nsp1b_2 [Trichonephila inaurata madagascariensis]
MGLLCIFLIVSCLSLVVSSHNALISEAELKAIQEKLDKYNLLEEFLRLILDSDAKIEGREELAEREEKCLPIGAQCSFASGPKCCTIRTRCVIWDRQRPDGKGNGKWTSHCREYNGGVWVDNVIKFFKKLG